MRQFLYEHWTSYFEKVGFGALRRFMAA